MGDVNEPAPPLARGAEYRGGRAASNTLVFGLGQLIVLVIALLTTPITINHLGLALTGAWTIATMSIAYLTVIDPGFADIVTRYGARAQVRGESHVAARICSLGSLFWLGFGVILAPVVYLVTPVLVHHVSGIGPGARSSVIDFFYWTFLLLIFGSLLATLSGRLTALGENWIVTIIDVSTRVVYCVVLIVLLYRGWKLGAIVVATSAQYALAYLATIVVVSAKDSWPYRSPRHLDRHLLRELYRFGGWLQFNSLLDTLTNDTDPLILGIAVNASTSGLWSIANRLARQITYFAYIPQSQVLPAMSASHAAEEGLDGMRRMYERAQRVVVPIGAFLAGTVIAFGPLMLKAWIGLPNRLMLLRHEVHSLNVAVFLVALTMMVGLPRPVTGNAIMAMGRVGLGVRAQTLAFCVNAVLTLALVVPYGLTGVLIGTLAARATASGYLLIRFSKMMESTFSRLCWPWMWPLVAVTAVAALAGHVAMTHWTRALQDRWVALLALIVLGLGYTVLYAIGLRLTRFFRSDDLRWLRSVAPGRLGVVISPGVIRVLTGSRP